MINTPDSLFELFPEVVLQRWRPVERLAGKVLVLRRVEQHTLVLSVLLVKLLFINASLTTNDLRRRPEAFRPPSFPVCRVVKGI